MSVVGILDAVTDWVQENICSEIKLKVPPKDSGEAAGTGYEYKRRNPAAFALFRPSGEELPPPEVSPVPSVCIRLIEGAEDLAASKGGVRIQLCFCVWDTGIHGGDLLLPSKDNVLEAAQWTGPEADAYFQQGRDGWREVWNFVDIALRKIDSTAEIGGYAIDQREPVKFGPFARQDTIPDFYPFWYAWVSFRLTYPIRRNIGNTEEFL